MIDFRKCKFVTLLKTRCGKKENKLLVNIDSHNNYCFDVLYWMPIPKLPK